MKELRELKKLKELKGLKDLKKLLPSDVMFPEQLKNLDQVVKVLHVVGDAALLSLPSLAIVGARKATPYGLSCAKRFAQLAARQGITIVSGGAIGCDQAAHRGAIEAGGRNIVVLGCGADVVYPAKAKTLYDKILEMGGVCVSEAPWGSQPNRFCFIRRNRIIAGLAQATLIVEAGLPSGTFSTADATLAQGKEVLVVPGSIHSKESMGSNQLLMQGALPVVDDESFLNYLADIFPLGECGGSNTIFGNYSSQNDMSRHNDTLFLCDFAAGKERDLQTEESLIAAIIAKASSAEELCILRDGNLMQTIRELSALEFEGKIVRLRDGRYSIRGQG